MGFKRPLGETYCDSGRNPETFGTTQKKYLQYNKLLPELQVP